MATMTLASLAAVPGLLVAALICAATAFADQSPPKRACLSPGETREVVAARKLSAPFMALRTAGTHAHGETIGIRLCRFNDDLMYEVTVLRRDGRVVKVLIDAIAGKIVRSLNDR